MIGFISRTVRSSVGKDGFFLTIAAGTFNVCVNLVSAGRVGAALAEGYGFGPE